MHNTFWEFDPSPEQIADGFHGSSSVFLAVHDGGRFIVDVEWRPVHDPAGGFLVKLYYSPYGRTERGQRIETPVEFPGSEVVRKIEVRSRVKLVVEIESLLEYGAETRRELN